MALLWTPNWEKDAEITATPIVKNWAYLKSAHLREPAFTEVFQISSFLISKRT